MCSLDGSVLVMSRAYSVPLGVGLCAPPPLAARKPFAAESAF